MRKFRKISGLFIIAMLVGITLFAGIDVAAYDANPDITNDTGQPIWDVEIVLDGNYAVTEHFDGFSDGANFNGFTWWYDEETDTTHLLWYDVQNGDCTEEGKEGWIADGETFHVGWSTNPYSDETDIIEIYGTVPPEGGGEHENVGDFDFANAIGEYTWGAFFFTGWNNILPSRVIRVDELQYGLFSQPLDLSDLNGRVLGGSLTPIEGEWILMYEEAFTVDIPLEPGEFPYVVMAFDTRECGSAYEPNTLYVQFHPPDPPLAAVSFEPDPLNLKSRGRWITTYIELPEGYDVNNIDISTIKISYINSYSVDIPAESHPTEIDDYDSDGIPDLKVKFDRSDVLSATSPGDYTVTVTGELTDGTEFEGYGTIIVM